MAATDETFLTVREAAREARVSAPTLYRLVQRNVVPAIRVGAGGASGPIRIPAGEFRSWLLGDPRDAA